MVGNLEGHPRPGGNLLGYLGPEPSKRPCSLSLIATAVLQGSVCQNPTAGTTSDLGPYPISASQVSRPRQFLLCGMDFVSRPRTFLVVLWCG